jgi:hypothetical protein
MPATITVSTLTGLYDALAHAKGGETILLAAGDYGKLSLSNKSGFDITFPSNVTITSADPGNPASFSGMDVKGAANLTLDGLTFDYTFAPGHSVYSRPFKVNGSDNITIRNSTFDGDVAQGVSATADGYGFAIGLSVGGSTGITLENNEIFNFHRGIVSGGCDNYTIVGNDIHSIRSDGMDFTQVSNTLIEGNYIHDFNRSLTSGDHADMIQFWTNGTTIPSENVTIRGNHLDIGAGDSTQSIFMRNDMVDLGLAGTEMYYRNILIEENVIVNGHAHGITVGETAGLTIRNNSVLHSDGGNVDGLDAAVEIPRINVAPVSTGVSITNNAMSTLTGWAGQAGWLVNNNAFIQDQNSQAPGYYGDIFLSSSLQLQDGLHDFRALEGGMLDQLNAGATETRDSAVVGVTAQFNVTDDPGNDSIRIFDATQSAIDLAALPRGTMFLWNFGDGTSARGTVVSHAYTHGGAYSVTLTIVTPNGTPSSIMTPVKVDGPEILSMTTGQGFTAYEAGDVITIAAPKMMTAEGLQLGAKGVAAAVAREHVTDILGANDFGIDLTLKADVTNTAGEVFRLHGSFVAAVEKTGELSFRAFTTAGEVVVTTKGAHLSDLASHDISINLSDGNLQIIVDGRLAGSMAMLGTLKSDGTHSLAFGNPWGKANFNGDLTAFEITKDADDFQSVAETVILNDPFGSLALDPLVAIIGGGSRPTSSPASHDAASFLINAQDTHAKIEKIAADQGRLSADAAQDYRPEASLGDRFEFLAHHLSDHILS